MKITIEGKRAEGKSALAILLYKLLNEHGYLAKRPDVERGVDLEKYLKYYTSEPRNVEIVEVHNTEEVWDRKVSV